MKKLLLIVMLLVPSLVLAGRNPITSNEIWETNLEYRNTMGELFITTATVSLAAAASHYFLIDLGSTTPVNTYMLYEISPGTGNIAGMDFRVYKDSYTAVVSSGTVGTTFNYNAARPKTSGAVVYHNPSIAATGATIFIDTFRTFGNDVALKSDLPIILPKNASYLVGVHNNNTAGVVVYIKLFRWESK